MPTVPVSRETSVRSNPLPSARVNTSAPLSAFGGGDALTQSNNAAQNLNNDISGKALDIHIQQKAYADEVRTRAADLELSKAETDVQVMVDGMKGKNAFGAPDVMDKEWKTRADKIREGLSNDQQKAQFDKVYMARTASLYDFTKKHVASESKKYDKQLTEAYVVQAQNQAAMNYMDIGPRGKVDQSILIQEYTIKRYGKGNGVPEEVIFKSIAEAKSGTYTAVIGKMIENQQTDEAMAYLESKSDSISDEDKNLIETLQKKAVVELKKNQIKNGANLINDFLVGKAGVYDQQTIKNLYQNKIVSEDLGKAVIRAINHPITEEDFDDEGNDKSFVDLASWALDAKEQKTRNELVTNILNGFSDNALSQRNMILLVQTAMNQGKDQIKQRIIRNNFDRVLNAYTEAGYTDNQATHDYLQAVVIDGQNPEDAANAIIGSFGIQDDNKADTKEKEPSIFGVSKSPQPTKGSGLNDLVKRYVDVNMDFGKGLIASIASTPQVIGAFLKEYGESPEQNRNFWNDFLSPEPPLAKMIINSIPALKQKRIEAKETAIKLGDDLIDKNLEWIAQQGLTRPEGKGLDGVAYDLGAGGGSVAVAVGMTVVTKNPLAIAAMFGAMGKANAYTEARREGLAPEISSNISNVQGLADFGLQFVGLNFMLKNYGGRLLNAGVRSVVLGGQTGIQSVTKDVLSPWNEKDAYTIAKDASYHAMIGVLLGFSTSAIIDIAVKDGTIKKFQEIEAKTEFGKQLQQQMRDKQNIPLHPAEEGKSEVERLYGKQDLEGKLKFVKIVEAIKEEVDPVMKDFEEQLATFEGEGGASNKSEVAREQKAFEDAREANIDEYLQAQAEGEGMVRSSAIDGEQEVSSVVSDGKKLQKSGQEESSVIEADGQEGTGVEKQRGLSKSVETDAIHKGLVEDLGDLPTYQTRDMKEVANKVSEFIGKDPVLAKRIALGEVPEQGGIRSQEMFTGLKIKAEIDGDVNMLRDLALSDKATALATELGQRVKALDSNSPDSPVDAIREVKKAREEAVKSKIKKDDISSEKKKIVKEIKKETKKAAPTKETWESFIRSIQC